MPAKIKLLNQVDIQSVFKMPPKKGKVLKPCLNCGKEFSYPAIEVWRKYCNRECFRQYLFKQKEAKKFA